MMANNTRFKKGMTPWNKGKKGVQVWSAESRAKVSATMKKRTFPQFISRPLDKNPNWKGDEVSYNGLHKWITRNLGRPKECEHCTQGELTGHQIHWANVSGNYKRHKAD